MSEHNHDHNVRSYNANTIVLGCACGDTKVVSYKIEKPPTKFDRIWFIFVYPLMILAIISTFIMAVTEGLHLGYEISFLMIFSVFVIGWIIEDVRRFDRHKL